MTWIAIPLILSFSSIECSLAIRGQQDSRVVPESIPPVIPGDIAPVSRETPKAGSSYDRAVAAQVKRLRIDDVIAWQYTSVSPAVR